VHPVLLLPDKVEYKLQGAGSSYIVQRTRTLHELKRHVWMKKKKKHLLEDILLSPKKLWPNCAFSGEEDSTQLHSVLLPDKEEYKLQAAGLSYKVCSTRSLHEFKWNCLDDKEKTSSLRCFASSDFLLNKLQSFWRGRQHPSASSIFT